MSPAANSTGGHTPTPWAFERIEYPRGRDVSFQVNDANGRDVVQTYMREIGSEDRWIDQDREKVELIVRAVNNHDALVAALRKVNEILTVPAAEYVPAISDAWAVIDAALKAVAASPVGERGEI